MGKLTQKDSQGNWSLKGVRWEDISTGQIITEEVWERLYGALWKLMQYEESEPDPEKVAEMAERDTAKAPKHAPTGYGMICPDCGNLTQLWQKYCGECGRKLREE